MKKLDKSALKFNQGAIVLLIALAFLFNLPLLVAFVMIVMITGTIYPQAGLFKLTYKHIAKPLGIIKPNIVEEDSSQHRFAQGLGGIFLLASYIALVFNPGYLGGWALALIVLALAFINLTMNFCLGCFIYFQLAKLGIFNSRQISGDKNA